MDTDLPPLPIRIRISCWIQIRMASPRTISLFTGMGKKIIPNKFFNLVIQTPTTFLAGSGSGKMNADLEKLILYRSGKLNAYLKK